MTTAETPTTPKTVADVVRAARAKQGMTLREFAEALGVPNFQAVSYWENGANEPGAQRIAEWFNDERQWVHELAVEIFVARYRATLLTRPASVAA